MTPNSAGAALATIESAFKAVDTYSGILGKSRNLIEATAPLRVEPLLMIDNSLIYSTDFLPDVVQTMQSQFTGFWLMGVDVLADVDKAMAINQLAVLNPTRDSGYFDFVKKMGNKVLARECMYFSKEAYKFGLPCNHSWQVRAGAVENVKEKGVNVTDVANLALGKMVKVSLAQGDQKRDFNVAIRLMAVDADQATLTNFATDRSAAASFSSRVGDWMDNKIGLADLLFCLDLGRERKRQLLADKSGLYAEVRKRQMGHKRAGLTTGQASVAEASNLVILSKEFCDNLQAQHGLDIDDAKDRGRIMDNMLAMIIAVVDRRDLRVKFYYNGLRATSSMGVNDIRIANRKQNGPDLMDIFAALKEGSAPRY